MAFVWRVRRHPVEVCAVQDSRGLIVLTYPPPPPPSLAHHIGTDNVNVVICVPLKRDLVCVDFSASGPSHQLCWEVG